MKIRNFEEELKKKVTSYLRIIKYFKFGFIFMNDLNLLK